MTGSLAPKNIVLLALRIYYALNLLLVAESGGLVKWGWGVEGLVANLIPKLGSPFTDAPLLFAYGVLLAEVFAPVALMLGVQTKLFGLISVVNFIVASYAHIFLWGGDLDSILVNVPNVHGAAIYGLMAAVFMLLVAVPCLWTPYSRARATAVTAAAAAAAAAAITTRRNNK